MTPVEALDQIERHLAQAGATFEGAGMPIYITAASCSSPGTQGLVVRFNDKTEVILALVSAHQD
jgi:hypothetical protein